MSKGKNNLNEQRFLRQQLAMSALHAATIDTAADELHRRACLQASLNCLEQGLRYYLSASLNLPLRSIHGLKAELPLQENLDFKQQELAALSADPSSWMRELGALTESIFTKEPVPDAAEVPTVASSQIIARNSDSYAYWAQLTPSQIRVFHAQVEELLERHSEQDLEY